jgi:hypothetical protein
MVPTFLIYSFVAFGVVMTQAAMNAAVNGMQVLLFFNI